MQQHWSAAPDFFPFHWCSHWPLWGKSTNKTGIDSYFCLQPFRWRQWSRILTWPCLLPVTVATLVSWRACGRDRALTWTESSSSTQRQSLNKAVDSMTSLYNRTSQSVPLLFIYSLMYFLFLSFLSFIFTIHLFALTVPFISSSIPVFLPSYHCPLL